MSNLSTNSNEDQIQNQDLQNNVLPAASNTDLQYQKLSEISEKLNDVLSSISSDDTSQIQQLQLISVSLSNLEDLLQTQIDNQVLLLRNQEAILSYLDSDLDRDDELYTLLSGYVQYNYDRNEANDSLVNPDLDYQYFMKDSQAALISLNLIMLVVFLFFLGSYFSRALFRRF